MSFRKMSSYQKVFLSFLYRLSRYFGILEFRFDAKERKFVESRVGFYYVWLWHWIHTTPICILGIRVVVFMWIDNTVRNEIPEVSYQVNSSHLEFFFLLNITGSWNIVKNAKCLQEILNSILQLKYRHRQLFGRPVYVPEKYFVINFIRECFSLIWQLTPYSEFYVLYVRLSLTAYLVDMAIILYFCLLQSLATRLKSYATKSERNLYIQYIVDLLDLRRKGYQFIWPVYLCRVIEELTFLCHSIVAFYWTKKHKWLTNLVKRIPRSNVLPLLILARRIFKMENDILHCLYEKEIIGLLRKPSDKQYLRLRKV